MVQSRGIEQAREIYCMLRGIDRDRDLAIGHEWNGRLAVPPLSTQQSPVGPPGSGRSVEGDAVPLQLFCESIHRNGFIPAGAGVLRCRIELL
jgi:hypothetical protein